MGRILIVANWKMSPASLAEAKHLFDLVVKGIKNMKNAEVVICPPFIYIPKIQNTKYKIQIGAQDCFWEEKGAYTGEISPLMLKKMGVEYIIVGHSERRRIFGETQEMINKKIKAALAAGLKPILCVENPLQAKKWPEIIIALEPVSAISTGKPFNIQKAKKVRESLARFKRVLYGGSVNSQNVRDYIKKAGFQGLLVSSASLIPREFIKIVKTAETCYSN